MWWVALPPSPRAARVRAELFVMCRVLCCVAVVSCRVVSCRVVSCCVALCCVVLCCVVLLSCLPKNFARQTRGLRPLVPADLYTRLLSCNTLPLSCNFVICQKIWPGKRGGNLWFPVPKAPPPSPRTRLLVLSTCLHPWLSSSCRVCACACLTCIYAHSPYN
jgi:hypothetical protein